MTINNRPGITHSCLSTLYRRTRIRGWYLNSVEDVECRTPLLSSSNLDRTFQEIPPLLLSALIVLCHAAEDCYVWEIPQISRSMFSRLASFFHEKNRDCYRDEVAILIKPTHTCQLNKQTHTALDGWRSTPGHEVDQHAAFSAHKLHVYKGRGKTTRSRKTLFITTTNTNNNCSINNNK